MRKYLLLACLLPLTGCGIVGLAGFAIPLEHGIRGKTALAQGYEALCEDVLDGTYSHKGRGSCDKGPADVIKGALE